MLPDKFFAAVGILSDNRPKYTPKICSKEQNLYANRTAPINRRGLLLQNLLAEKATRLGLVFLYFKLFSI
ncbi:MAG: hypothetical protein A2W98_12480 [Bacteroidetes bacterium GWF2_33_38]|nr:MAG: hypothetical protein A2W98_12480 [Bacteroidetes bacterium GWF2_33_38]OFY72720.1 MAG: hypothetical protein A2265_03580 [Bacteroidetes bacterium RIFOXYA12_FULL_33_9]OFY87476.1 MAG: hypothetical protein A2236_00145 [Bacteroidetes bacterium RIFOXYA2_FULL_33_7]